MVNRLSSSISPTAQGDCGQNSLLTLTCCPTVTPWFNTLSCARIKVISFHDILRESLISLSADGALTMERREANHLTHVTRRTPTFAHAIFFMPRATGFLSDSAVFLHFQEAVACKDLHVTSGKSPETILKRTF